MKKLIALLLATGLLLAASACGNTGNASTPTPNTTESSVPVPESAAPASPDGVAPEFEEMTLRFGTASAEGTITVDTFQAWSDRVSEATGGKVVIEIHAGSTLGTSTEMLQSTQMGVIDLCVVQPSALYDLGVNEMIVLSLPYIFRSYDHYWNVLNSEIGTELLDYVSNAGISLVGFGYFPDGARNYFTTEGNAIRQLSDIKGMKLRIQSYAIDQTTANVLGFSATTVSISELYSALQSGIVDGAEQPLSAIDGNKYYEVCDYVTLDEHSYNLPVLLFAESSWAKCSDELKAILRETWTESIEEMRPKLAEYESSLLAKFEENGVEIIELTDREDWVTAMADVWSEYTAGVETLVERIQMAQ